MVQIKVATAVDALRERFRILREKEFPWTAETTYLNNASIGPIPERTRRCLDAFNARRTAPYLPPTAISSRFCAMPELLRLGSSTPT